MFSNSLVYKSKLRQKRKCKSNCNDCPLVKGKKSRNNEPKEFPKVIKPFTLKMETTIFWIIVFDIV